MCVIKTLCKKDTAELVHLNVTADINNCLQVTPWHPIYHRGRWIFPAELGTPVETHCIAVYSLILKQPASHIAVVGGIPCVTLAHGIKGDIREHPYWGTNNILEDLKKHSDWQKGVIQLHAGCVKRSPQTGVVIGIELT